MELGKAIAQRRKELWMKQKELAEKLFITPSYIGNIERGVVMPAEKFHDLP